VAVVAGFLILRNLTDDGTAAVAGPSGDPGAALDDGSTETTLPDPILDVITSTTTIPTTTTIPLVTEGATVAVANANTVGGSAGDMTKTLELEGFTMGTAVNASGPNLQDSIVYYDPGVAGALDVANSVAFVLGGLSVSEVTTPVPTESGSLDGAGVLLLLGDNQAGRSAAELQAEANSAAGAAEVEVVDAPEVSGSDDATSTTVADDG
ncbi:MAG: LytR C-terminal domain-containing protein, partial [Actinomycetota bacterium]